ncbi:MAG: hypothetical protein K2P78_03075, partial [Gemmataceae bacterium]|nr:hypothetical protein [Gemmataceae bacterium]
MSIRFQHGRDDEGFALTLSGECPAEVATREYRGRGAASDAVQQVAAGAADRFAESVTKALARYAGAVAQGNDAERRLHEVEQTLREAPHSYFGPALTARVNELIGEVRAVLSLRDRAGQDAEDALAALIDLRAQAALAVRDAVNVAIRKRRTAAVRARDTSEAALRASVETHLPTYFTSVGELDALGEADPIRLAAAALAETHPAAFGPAGHPRRGSPDRKALSAASSLLKPTTFSNGRVAGP